MESLLIIASPVLFYFCRNNQTPILIKPLFKTSVGSQGNQEIIFVINQIDLLYHLCFPCVFSASWSLVFSLHSKRLRRRERKKEKRKHKGTGCRKRQKAQVVKKDNFIDKKNFLVSLCLDHIGFIFPHFYTRNNEVNDIQRYFQPVLFLPYVSLVRWTLIKTPFL